MAIVRRSRDEWAAIVAELGKSGLAPRQFSVQRGINVSTLLWWRGTPRPGVNIDVPLRQAKEKLLKVLGRGDDPVENGRRIREQHAAARAAGKGAMAQSAAAAGARRVVSAIHPTMPAIEAIDPDQLCLPFPGRSACPIQNAIAEGFAASRAADRVARWREAPAARPDELAWTHAVDLAEAA
jgi:hypothetical protein